MTAQSAPRATRRERIAWYLYDFGNSAYASVVLLAVYSAYFKEQVVGGAEGSRLWGLAVGIAMFVVAVTSPFLGAIADFSGAKKKFLLFFTSLSCFFTGLLMLVGKGDVLMGMVFFILAEIGYRSAQVFYNGLLPEIAAPWELGRISGIGWAIGTAGGIVILLLILPLVILIKGAFIVRLSFVITAVFFALFALPLFLWLRERAQPQPLPPGENYLTVAISRLRRTFREASRFREFIKFIVAFLIYNDAVIMALDFSAIIGAVLFGLNQQQLILFFILVQATNVIGAYGFGYLADEIGCKRSIIFSNLFMVAVVLALYFTRTMTGFFIVGALAGIAMAGLQSVSRTMVSVMAPPGRSAEFYGLFAVAGRTSSFIGPTVYGMVAAEAALWFQRQGLAERLAEQQGQRVAILTIALFLVLGLMVLLTVNERAARAAAEAESAAA